MSVFLWRLASQSLRTEVQLVSNGWALFGRNRPLSVAVLHSAMCVRRSVGALTRMRTASLWQLVHRLARGLKKGCHPSGRVLLSGAVAFLWEKERIPVEDAISSLKEYDNRVKSQLRFMLEESPLPNPSTSEQELSPTEEHGSHFNNQLQVLLQQRSEKALSSLPVAGLQTMGRVSGASVVAEELFHQVTLEAIGRLGEAKAYLYKPLKSRRSKQCQEGDIVPAGAEECQEEDTAISERAMRAVYTKEMLGCYDECSKRRVAELPLVGLQSPGPVYTFSRSVAGCGRGLFAGDSNIHNQALFLAHLGFSLWDLPSLSSFPQSLTGLQIDSASLVLEGFTASSVREALDSAVQQGKTLLSMCTSPHLLLDTFESVSGREGELQSMISRTVTQDSDKGCEGTPVTLGSVSVCADKLQSSLIADNANWENQHVDTDLYLEQSGWERFAEAQSCTVYRKPHDSGLFMYKVIGRYTDISIKDFLDVQIDHACRKGWDSYVQKLETVDVDPESGSEVVHWIMKFPFPMSSREYLYVRRVWVNRNVAVLINRSVTHPAIPAGRNCVRVQDYVSHTVMQPHTTSDQDGFEYEVTYFDNPQTNLPSSCVNWVATAAMPEFLTKVHTAARQRKRTQSGLQEITTL